jgi:hypothetical protein
MNHFAGLSEFSVVVPTAVVLASLFIRKLFKVSFAAAAAGIGAPLVLPLRELPLLQHLSHLPQGYLVGGAWGGILCGALVWAVLKPAVSGAVASLGLLRLGYFALLGGALIVSGLLIVNPEPLASNFPGWKGPAGILLLAASCISVSQALWRLVRATTLVVIWGGVSVVLASSIFLDKLPQDIKRDDLYKIKGLIPLEVVNKAFDYAQAFSTHGVDVRKFLRIADDERPQKPDVEA